MLAVWKAAVEQLEQGQDVILATILSVTGSSPRHVGTHLLVKRDGSIVGTIGGGLFEADVQRFAATALRDGVSHRAVFSFRGEDARSSEMICGGEAQVLVEFVKAGDDETLGLFRSARDLSAERRRGYLFTNVDLPMGGQKKGVIHHMLMQENGSQVGGFSGDGQAIAAMPEPRLLKPAQLLDIEGQELPVFLEWIRPRGTAYIFGAGHVGLCVAHLAAYVDFRVVVVDDRAEFADPRKVVEADEVAAVDTFDQFFAEAQLDEDSYVVIVTRGHAHDRTVLGHALKTRSGYIGMIGSRRKTNLIFQSLLQEGFSREDLQRVHAPIGLSIGGETPQEIGISIIGEMIDVRSRSDRIERRGD